MLLCMLLIACKEGGGAQAAAAVRDGGCAPHLTPAVPASAALRCTTMRFSYLLKTPKPPFCRKRYFSVKEAYEEGLVDKLVPGYKMNRFRKIAKDAMATQQGYFASDKPKFRFTRKEGEQ
eukprot:GHRQ01035620.1.p3 GENE.GHRQ01035620.1~~GHRQ01035620.1.p3  ORF type:complete len:120 (-),score=56.85 GHRQ01035620.1:648-1007(-)